MSRSPDDGRSNAACLIPVFNRVAKLGRAELVAKRLECAVFRRFLSVLLRSNPKAPEYGALQTLRDDPRVLLRAAELRDRDPSYRLNEGHSSNHLELALDPSGTRLSPLPSSPSACNCPGIARYWFMALISSVMLHTHKLPAQTSSKSIKLHSNMRRLQRVAGRLSPFPNPQPQSADPAILDSRTRQAVG
jgi:hypothetical protein